MGYNKTIIGFCPVQNSETTISVFVVPDPTFDDPNLFELGTTDCTYARLNGCELLNAENCPLRNSIK